MKAPTRKIIDSCWSSASPAKEASTPGGKSIASIALRSATVWSFTKTPGATLASIVTTRS